MARDLHIYIHRHFSRDATMDPPRAAGLVWQAPEGQVLLIKRSPGSLFGGTWGLPAGGIEPGERPWDAAARECLEEVGHMPSGPMQLVWTSSFFHCFYVMNPAFEPILNHEHTDFIWANPDRLPTPLHPHVAEQIKAATGRRA